MSYLGKSSFGVFLFIVFCQVSFASDWYHLLRDNDFQTLYEWQNKTQNLKEIPYEKCQINFERRRDGLLYSHESQPDHWGRSYMFCWSMSENVATLIPIKVSLHSFGLSANLAAISWQPVEIKKIDGHTLADLFGSYKGVSLGIGALIRVGYKSLRHNGIELRFNDNGLCFFNCDLSYTVMSVKFRQLTSEDLLTSEYKIYINSQISGSRSWDETARRNRWREDPLEIPVTGPGYRHNPVTILKYIKYNNYLVHGTSEMNLEELTRPNLSGLLHFRFKKVSNPQVTDVPR